MFLPKRRMHPRPRVLLAAEPVKKTPPPQPTFWSEVKLHEVIRAANPGYTGNGQFQIDQRGQVQAIALDKCGVTDISPFKGMNLMALYLLECAVSDISMLADMPLVELYLENTGGEGYFRLNREDFAAQTLSQRDRRFRSFPDQGARVFRN